MDVARLNDDQLLATLKALVRQEREDTAAVVAHLVETERRQLVQRHGYPSLFEYCVKVLGYSEPSAYHRIRAARAVVKKPELMEMLKKGELHLRAIVLLHPHLDSEKSDELVCQARGKSQRDVEAIVAPLAPAPPSRDVVRVVAASSPQPVESLPLFESPAPVPHAVIPASRVHISFSASAGFMTLLQRAQQLLWHRHPDGRLEGVFEDALQALLQRKDPGLWNVPKTGKSAGRALPRWVRHEVWNRDGGRCAFVAKDGVRCEARNALEFDHIVAWAFGGSSNDPKNIRLLCRSHNQLKAREAGLSWSGNKERF